MKFYMAIKFPRNFSPGPDFPGNYLLYKIKKHTVIVVREGGVIQNLHNILFVWYFKVIGLCL